MTKRTNTSKLRHFEKVGKDVIKRDMPISALPRIEKPCASCKKPMLLSQGQIAEFHGECKKDGKAAIRKRKLIYTTK